MISIYSKKWIIIVAAILGLSACRKDVNPPESEEMREEVVAGARQDHGYHNSRGYVYTLSNQTDGNKVLVYRRDQNGELSFVAGHNTGGNGTGGGLGNQGALALTEKDDMLLAVNPASNTISSFKKSGNQLRLVSTVSSGGMMPISIAQHERLVYVLNAGGNGNISGFWMLSNGKLLPIPRSTRPLSSNASGPAQVSFVNDGKVLVVTEKMTNKIITYTVNHWGVPGTFHSINAASPTPFGFAARGYGNIIVSEAAGGAEGASALSSYRIHPNGNISLVEGPVSAGQTAACWVVVTENKRYAYTTNTGSHNISSFKVSFGGALDVLHAVAAPSGMGPIDAALADGSKFLYVLNSGSNSISAYKVKENGSLQTIQTVNGVPAGATGLVAD